MIRQLLSKKEDNKELELAINKLGLSQRDSSVVIRVARAIADYSPQEEDHYASPGGST